jgi:hypothetical protein
MSSKLSVEDIGKKLIHPLKEIRGRTLNSLKFKISNSLLKINPEVTTRPVILKSILEALNLLDSGQKDDAVFLLKVLSDASNYSEGVANLIEVGALECFNEMKFTSSDADILYLVSEILGKLGGSGVATLSVEDQENFSKGGLNSLRSSTFPPTDSFLQKQPSLKFIPKVPHSKANDGWTFDQLYLSPIDTKFLSDFMKISSSPTNPKFSIAMDILLNDYGPQIFLQQPKLFEVLLGQIPYFSVSAQVSHQSGTVTSVDATESLASIEEFVSNLFSTLLRELGSFKCINQGHSFVNNTPEVSYAGMF